MKKIIVSMHVSLDGFVAGKNGEMDWIIVDEAMFDHIGKITDEADTALYGLNTYNMMNSYWPTAGEDAGASKHDIEHSRWYNQSQKIVLSKTMKQTGDAKTKVIGDNVAEQISAIKKQGDKNIVIFGSPTATHYLFNHGLIDELWLFVNPIVLGQGIPMFKDIEHISKLKLIETKQFNCGVAGLHYLKL